MTKNEIIEANYAWNIQEYSSHDLQPGGVRHEVRPIRMRYFSSDFRASEEPFSEVFMVYPGLPLLVFQL